MFENSLEFEVHEGTFEMHEGYVRVFTMRQAVGSQIKIPGKKSHCSSGPITFPLVENPEQHV